MSKILFRIVGISIKCQALGSHSGAGKGFSLHLYDTMQIRVQVEMFLRTCCLVFRVVQKATSHSSWITLKMEAASSSKMVIPINNLHGIISENGILNFIPYRLRYFWNLSIASHTSMNISETGSVPVIR
jgi:hypothetical protein